MPDACSKRHARSESAAAAAPESQVARRMRRDPSRRKRAGPAPVVRTLAPTDATTPANSPPGSERKRRLALVLAFDHQHVGEVERRGADVDHDVVRSGRRRVDVLERQRLGRSERATHDGFHRDLGHSAQWCVDQRRPLRLPAGRRRQLVVGFGARGRVQLASPATGRRARAAPGSSAENPPRTARSRRAARPSTRSTIRSVRVVRRSAGMRVRPGRSRRSGRTDRDRA